MAMAKGQQMPQQVTEEKDLLSDQDYESMGLPGGSSPEAAKQRLLAILNELGVLSSLTQEGLKEITEKIDEYIKIAQTGNLEQLEKHPIGQLLAKASGEIAQKAKKQPTDFSSMMPPGGGMSGR